VVHLYILSLKEYSPSFIIFYNIFVHTHPPLYTTYIFNYSLFYIILYNYHILFLLFNNNTVNINCKSQFLKIDNSFFLFSFLLFFFPFLLFFFLLLFLFPTPKRATAPFYFSLLTWLSGGYRGAPILTVYCVAGMIEAAVVATRTRGLPSRSIYRAPVQIA
jgi:hypothetical protein